MSHYHPEENGLSFERIARSLCYLMFMLGGVSSLFFPYRVVSTVASPKVAFVWAVFMAIGGLLCFISVLIDNWVLEYIGIPLIAMCFCTLAAAAFFSLFTSGIFIASGFFSLGVTAFLVSRFRLLKITIKYNNHINR